MKELDKSSSIWDTQVDRNIIANLLMKEQMKELFKGFVIIYDIQRNSTLNYNKVSILEESFKRSKFGPCHWDKQNTNNNVFPIRLALKWRNVVLAEAVGENENGLKTRLAQAVLSKLSDFSIGIEAKWSYYRDGILSERFENPNPRKNHIYRVLQRSQFKAVAEIISYIDTFANSDSFAEVIFSMDFSNQEKKQLMEYIDKSWCTKLTYRTLSKSGVKNTSESYVFVYQIRSGEELRHWLVQSGGDNDRYRLVSPGKHRRPGSSDPNVREVLRTNIVDTPKETSRPEEKQPSQNIPPTVKMDNKKETNERQEVTQRNEPKNIENVNKEKKIEENAPGRNKDFTDRNKTSGNKVSEKENLKSAKGDEKDLEKLLDGFVLFYDANKTSEIDKDDWFTALCESFKLSKFGPLEVTSENIKPLRTRCVFKWKDIVLASAEGLTETQAKTAATLQIITKLEPFSYIIQAKEEYFCDGKVPQFLEDSDQSKNDFFRLVRRKDLPSYYTIFQTIDEFARSQSHGEIIFGPDFTWELKNEIAVYLKAKNLSHRYFTTNNQNPWTHMAVYQTVKPEELKDHLLKIGGENPKYKLILPPKAEPINEKTSEKPTSKETGKPQAPSSVKASPAKVVEKRKQPVEPPSTDTAEEIDLDSNKITIKLKKFKVDKVDYPEDTGGDFPGLIIWIGIRKNSVWVKNIFQILLESFKMSKFGELLIEESEENVWGRKEPFKKCIIKSNRKVLAVGLGDSKTEAKNSASLQVLRQLRKHCYTIQAKESYFKEGKATPYDFNPDPAKSHFYRVVKRIAFKDRTAMVNHVNEFAKKNRSEELIFGDDFTYDEREHILDHCRKINFSYRLMKCQSIKNIHTHIAIFHQQPPPVIKAELMKSSGENDMYRLIPPGEKITNQNNEADMWPETIENENKSRSLQILKSDYQPNGLDSKSQRSELQQQTPPQQNDKHARISIPNTIPSLINRTPVQGSLSPQKSNEKGNTAPAVKTVFKKPDEGKVSSNVSQNKTNDQKENASVVKPNNDNNPSLQPKDKPTTTNKQFGSQISQNKNAGQKSQNSLSNQPVGRQPLNNQPIGPQPLSNQPIGPQPLSNQPIGPQPLNNQPFGLQSLNNQAFGHLPLNNQAFGPLNNQLQPNQPLQFVPHQQEVPFGPQSLLGPLPSLLGPHPPVYGPHFMDSPLQFGPNPPTYVQPFPCEMVPLVMDQQLLNQPLSNFGQVENNSVPPSGQTQISVPSVTITVSNSPPPRSDLREELSKKRQIENRSRGTIIEEKDDSDGWSRKVFVANENADQRENTNTRRVNGSPVPGMNEDSKDLRERLKYRDSRRETKGPAESSFRRNSPERNISNRNRRYPQEQGYSKYNEGGNNRRSPPLDKRRMAPRNNPDRDGSREGRRFRDPSPEQRIVRCREGSYERRVYHDPTRGTGKDRVRGRSRSRSPRRPVRSPSPMAHFRDLWDNIPAVVSESIFMYKYVKQDSTTEKDPYALLRATRSLKFNVDFDFIKEQTAINEWYVSVELISDQHKFHPLVGEGMARTKEEASLRAAKHAVDTVQKACQVIEPNLRYFCEGGEPDFIINKSPMKTSIYEIIQNMNPDTPLTRYTIEIMFNVFLSSDVEDLFFLATDFSYMERVLVIEVATKMNLWWRLFGPRHPEARQDDIVSTQHVCVFKQKSALQLVRELMDNRGSTDKYTLVDPREYRLTRPRKYDRDLR
ncbi:uncharacterized protein LOC129002640 [Macrosteles quadrilineatus]|uniref:uncharacterized protein LOC129002640 n=1 Tax=Macrosteles quadrilineatus TaxID=74068 RepID=UPI0023E317C6|nr:uncharacterized protein LOC129002640 [Macrosteles quadrilineatus]